MENIKNEKLTIDEILAAVESIEKNAKAEADQKHREAAAIKKAALEESAALKAGIVNAIDAKKRDLNSEIEVLDKAAIEREQEFEKLEEARAQILQEEKPKFFKKLRFNKRDVLILGTACLVTLLALNANGILKVVKEEFLSDKPGIEQNNETAVASENKNSEVVVNRAEVIQKIEELLVTYQISEPSSAVNIYTLLNDGEFTNTEDYDDAFVKYNALVMQSYYDGSTEIIDVVASAQPNLESQEEVMKAKAAIQPLIENPTKDNTALYGLNALAFINGYDDEFRGQSTRAHLLITELYRNAYPIVAENELEHTTLDLKKIEPEVVTALPYKLEGEVLFTVDKLATDLVTEHDTALSQDNAELIQEIKVRTR